MVYAALAWWAQSLVLLTGRCKTARPARGVRLRDADADGDAAAGPGPI